MSNEVSENIFQAIDIITAARIADLQYDKTLICTITDATKAASGEYTVSDTSSQFQAFSENTKYTKGTKVYVTVPNGDMNNQKLITGKCVSSDSTPYAYTAPYENFIDISGNILTSAKNVSLRANDNYDTDTSTMTRTEAGQEAIIFESSYAEGSGLTGYDRLGISGEFKTTVKGLGAVQGKYGLRLDMTVREREGAQEVRYQNYSFYLSSSGFYGNPYNYGVFTEQAKLFDLKSILANEQTETNSNVKEISYLRIVLFQNNDFSRNDGSVVPYKDSTGELLPYNIHARNVSINLGYDLTNFTDSKLILGSRNGLTYSQKKTDTNNAKELYLRLAYLDDLGKIRSITSDETLTKYLGSNAKVHWYRYKLDDFTANEQAGRFWSEIISTNDTLLNYKNDASNIREQHQDGILYPGEDNEEFYQTKYKEAISFYNNNKTWGNPIINNFNYSFIPDKDIQKEYIKVIIEAPSKQSIIDEVLNVDNTEVDEIYRYFKSVKGYNGVTDQFITAMMNLVYIGTQDAYNNFQIEYGSKGKPFYINGAAGSEGEVKVEPTDKTDQFYEEKLEAFKDYQRRMKNRSEFVKLKDLVTEKMTAIKQFESDMLTFNNEIPCINPATVDLIQGLQITCDPKSEGGYGGSYYIYSALNKSLINSSEGSKNRTLKATFKSLVTGAKDLDSASSITWYIPANNTMIKAPQAGNEYDDYANRFEKTRDEWNEAVKESGYDSDKAKEKKQELIAILRGIQLQYPDFKGKWNDSTGEVSTDGLAIIKQVKEEETPVVRDGYYEIKRKGSEIYDDTFAGDTIQVNNEQKFRIKDYYVENATNNTVKCKVEKGGRTYEAAVDLTFGITGSNGTSATFVLQLQDKAGNNLSYIPYPSEDRYFYIKPRLYDYNNEEVSLKDKYVTFSWYCGTSPLTETDKKAQAEVATQKEQIENLKEQIKKQELQYSAATGLTEEALNNLSVDTGLITDQNETAVKQAGELKKTAEIYYQQVEAITKEVEEKEKEIKYGINLVDDNNTTVSSIRIQGNKRARILVEDALSILNLAHGIIQASVEKYSATTVCTSEPLKDDNGKVLKNEDGSTKYKTIEQIVDLTTFLPLAIANSNLDVSYAAVPSQIIFNSKGDEADYYQDVFTIYNKHSNKIDVQISYRDTEKKQPFEKWGIMLQEEYIGKDYVWHWANETNWSSAAKYYPMLSILESGEIKLQRPKMFVKEITGMNKGYSIFAINPDGKVLWVQPILIIQNSFGSPMLNNWDGSLSIDEDNNTIMSAMVGAGSKNSDNSFSGVLMGEVESKTSLKLSDSSTNTSTKLGIYGFDKGIQSFGFRADGTGFLGAAGKGQILFDGDIGVIRSGNYVQSVAGMSINLNGGISSLYKNNDSVSDQEGASLAIYGNYTSAKGDNVGKKFNQGIEMDPTQNSIMRIFSTDPNGNSPKDLFKVGTDELFLQTLNYNSAKKTGTKIDLQNGKMDAYNFMIQAAKTGTNKYITIDSGADEYPLFIGDGGSTTFKVKWDGSITLGKGANITWGDITQTGTDPNVTAVQEDLTNFKNNLPDTVHEFFSGDKQTWADGFYDDEQGHLCIKASQIKSGFLDANLIKLANGFGGMGFREGRNAAGITQGIGMYVSNAEDKELYYQGKITIDEMQDNASRYIIMTQDKTDDSGVVQSGGIRLQNGPEAWRPGVTDSELEASNDYYVLTHHKHEMTVGTGQIFLMAGRHTTTTKDDKGNISKNTDYDTQLKLIGKPEDAYGYIVSLKDSNAYTNGIRSSVEYSVNEGSIKHSVYNENLSSLQQNAMYVQLTKDVALIQSKLSEYDSSSKEYKTLQNNLADVQASLIQYENYAYIYKTNALRGYMFGIWESYQNKYETLFEIKNKSFKFRNLYKDSSSNEREAFFKIEESKLSASSAIQVGSDRKIKNDIKNISSLYEKFFNSLKPVSYRLKTGEPTETHLGFIAQDVENALRQSGLTAKSFAGLGVPQKEDDIYTLAYSEFIALNTHMIQELQKEVAELKQEIQLLKGEKK